MPSSHRPRLRGGRDDADSAVLVLHGGREHSFEVTAPLQLSYLRMLDMYVGLRRASNSCAVYLLRYRVRGWNPGSAEPDPVIDGRWALDHIRRRHGDVPVALLGHSMGGRTAFGLADDESVVGVCGLAPWLPDGEPLPSHRPGQRFVIAHGTADQMTSSPLSTSYAQRLRHSGATVAKFEDAGGRHELLNHSGLWHRFAVQTTLGLVGDRPMPVGVTNALATNEAAGLQTPLPQFCRAG